MITFYLKTPNAYDPSSGQDGDKSDGVKFDSDMDQEDQDTKENVEASQGSSTSLRMTKIKMNSGLLKHSGHS